jgi:hypothetical protein
MSGWCSKNTSLVFRSHTPGAGSVTAADVSDSTWFGFGFGVTCTAVEVICILGYPYYRNTPRVHMDIR